MLTEVQKLFGAKFCKTMKWHLWTHYPDAIRAFGEVAIYACDIWEHLHIFYAKISFEATNKNLDTLFDQVSFAFQ